MAAPAGTRPDPQSQASDPSGSAWVSANAGSGKTHVLVNRVIRLLLNGTAPERILCLTYTRAAAAEMSNRLFSELSDWIAMDDGRLLSRIHERVGDVAYKPGDLAAARQLFAIALETPGGLKVQTIHAFCERLLQRFPVEAGMVPGFEVMDDQVARDVLGQARGLVLARAGAEPDSETAKNLAIIVGHTSADRFDDLLKSLISHRSELTALIGNTVDIDPYMDALAEKLGLAKDDSPVTLRAAAVSALDVAGYQHAMSSKFVAKGSRERIEQLVHTTSDDDRFAALCELFLTGSGGPRAAGGLVTKKAVDEAPDVHQFMLSEQDRLLRVIDKLNACRIHKASSALLHVGLQIISAYETEKRRRGLSDYDDLIAKTRELLSDSHASLWVLFKLDGGLDHVLIDEAQDTSPEQWSIIDKLTEEFFAGEGADPNKTRTVFAVGDYKQSIFSFQGADPAEFARMQAHFRRQIAGVGAELAEVPLLASFRSTPEVLATVDKVFEQPEAGLGLADEVHAHTARRTGHAGRVELWPLVVPDEDASAGLWQAPKWIDAGSHPRLKLARQVASTIRHWVSSGEELTPRGRLMRYSDILILVRQRTTFMDALVRALKLAGIPVAGADRLKLTQHIAVQDLLTLARFVLLPEDDLALASVLKGPFVERDDGVAFDDGDLYRLAHERGAVTLWQQLLIAAEEGYPCTGAINALKNWRGRAGFMTPYQFFAQVLVHDGGRKRLLKRLGTEASDPIEAFMNEALNFQAGRSPSLHDFIGWLEGADLQIKRDMDHSAEEVRIMTVHGAKGLEANVVILPDTTDVPTGRTTPDIMLVDTRLGPLPVWRLRSQDETAVTGQLRDDDKRRAREEYLRLLYVAMTRARDRLYIAGYSSKEEAKPESWYGLMSSVVMADGIETTDPLHERQVWRIDGEQKAKAEDRVEEGGLSTDPVSPPEWAMRPPAGEADSLRWFVPSKLGRDQGDEAGELPERVDPPLSDGAGDRYKRGNLIHKLLQILPDLPVAKRETAGQVYLARPGHGLAASDAADILNEVMGVLNDDVFAPVFSENSRAEVPLAAQLDLGTGVIGITGQIDRLVVTDTHVMIVDYKTNRPAPRRIEAADKAYVRQLAAYRSALQQIYPDRQVRAALLWTNTAQLMELPSEMLDAAI